MSSETESFELLPWQHELWQRLQARRAAGSLPHALLLSGPVGVGKEQFARRLAASLVCESQDEQPCGRCKACGLAAAHTHPDIHWLQPEEPGKAIKIDAVRELIARTTLTTQAAGSRVFLISPAEAMNKPSANALLKTLEEPSASSTLVLISSAPHRLPATIRSRCQSLLFKPVPQTEAEQWLQGRAGDPALLALTGGAPLLALQADQQAWLPAVQQLLEEMSELKSRKVNPMQVVEAWAQRPLEQMFDHLARVISDLVQTLSGAPDTRLFLPAEQQRLQSLAKNINLQALFRFYDGFNTLRSQMNHNLNAQMLFEKLVSDWLSLTRAGAR